MTRRAKKPKRTQTDQDFMELDAALNLANLGRYWIPKAAGQALKRLIEKYSDNLRSYTPMVLAALGEKDQPR